MNKSTKKDKLQLRFDTSTDKLACFIKKKPKPIEPETSEKRGRKKIKSYKERALQFQNDAFLENILSNILSEEFTGGEEIKKLMQDCELADQAEIHQGKIKSTYLDLNNDQPSDLLHKDLEYKLLLEGWKTQSLRESWKNSSIRSSTRVATEDQPLELQQKSQQYCPQLYQFYNPYYQQCYQPERKRRTVSTQQAQQYRINLNNLENDPRTTLMIRNIPNKYTQDLLLEELSLYKNKYDFFYLPIDYNNSCNVGYAFINFLHTKFILDFYKEFNGRKWKKFNSEKICSLAYARIQGTSALRSHFRNSHVMQQKDKRFRPFLCNELGDDQRNNLNKIIENQKQKI